MTTLLTIDWDAFIPEDVLWDLSHKENHFFAEAIWQHRSYLVHETKIDPLRDQFWSHINITDATEILVSDSHLDAHHILNDEEIETVILVDAHHDAWEMGKGDTPDHVQIDCGNWLRYWHDSQMEADITWFQPTWAAESFTLPEDIRFRDVFSLDQLDKMGDLPNPDIIHICRSGSWTPPWHDEDFLKFVYEPGLAAQQFRTVNREVFVDPFKIRMTKEDAMESARVHAKALAKVRLLNDAKSADEAMLILQEGV